MPWCCLGLPASFALQMKLSFHPETTGAILLRIMSLSFAYRKATQALNYYARLGGGRVNKLKALKLFFLPIATTCENTGDR
jgi:hypothetical protein